MNDDALTNTVTASDQQDWRNGGYPLTFNLWSGDYPGIVPLPSQLPAKWSYETDRILRSTIYHESRWAGALRRAIEKQAALGFYIDDTQGSAQRIKRSQELLLHADGSMGWVLFVQKHKRDVYCTNNGAFIEIIRQGHQSVDPKNQRTLIYSGPPSARPVGIGHLASSRCRRTGDPEYPVLYMDILGREHILARHQVMMYAALPRSDLNYFDVGFCAAHGAYNTIYKMAAMETYIREKISGSRALSLHLVTGISQKTLESAITTASAGQVAKGFMVYMGNIIIPLQGEQAASGYAIPLAEIPDGFNAKEEREDANIIYALNLGIPVQDIAPLSGQGLGTGTQTQIQQEEADGYGQAVWRKWFTQEMNQWVLPDVTTMHFVNTNDVRDQKMKADVALVRAQTRAAMITDGTITAIEARQLAADDKDIPQEFLTEDETPQGQLNDDEKMLTIDAQSTPSAPQIPAQPSPLRLAVQRAIAAARVKDDTNAELIIDGILTEKAATPLDMLLARTKERFALLSGEGDALIDKLERVLQDTYYEAYRLGTGGQLTEEGAKLIDEMIATQREYLQGFRNALRDESLSPAQTAARVQMYAESVKAPYWRGKTAGWPLPAVPGDGTTTCLTNCKCHLDIQERDGAGNADIYWQYGDTEDHCQTCIERAAEWAPLRIRDGELQP